MGSSQPMGVRSCIVDTGAEVEAAGMVLFEAIWTVEPLEE